MIMRCGVLRGTVLAALLATVALGQQQIKPGVLAADDLKRGVPSAYFFRGQSASVQLRNSAGISDSSGKLLLVGLVDTSGYAADVQAKYQGFLITEVRVNVEGSDLPPGQYGLFS